MFVVWDPIINLEITCLTPRRSPLRVGLSSHFSQILPSNLLTSSELEEDILERSVLITETALRRSVCVK